MAVSAPSATEESQCAPVLSHRPGATRLTSAFRPEGCETQFLLLFRRAAALMAARARRLMDLLFFWTRRRMPP